MRLDLPSYLGNVPSGTNIIFGFIKLRLFLTSDVIALLISSFEPLLSSSL